MVRGGRLPLSVIIVVGYELLSRLHIERLLFASNDPDLVCDHFNGTQDHFDLASGDAAADKRTR